MEKYETIQKQIDELRESIECLERKLNDGICGKPIILGACNVDDVVSIIEKKISARNSKMMAEKEQHGNE